MLVSSHLIGEMELVADRLIVIGRGRLLADTTVDGFISSRSSSDTLVRTADDHFGDVLERAGLEVRRAGDGTFHVHGAADAIGELARSHDVALQELTPIRASLEDVYAQATATSVEYVDRSVRPGDGAPAGATR